MDALIEELRDARDDYRAGAKLGASERSLLAVMTFLGNHPVIEDKSLLVPLAALLEAINHAAHGGRPLLFQPTARKGKRPLHPRESAERAVIAFCVELLVETKMPLGAAGKFVARQVAQLGIREKISAGTASGYHRDIDSREMSPLTKRAFGMMSVSRAFQGPLPESLPDAKAEVCAVLRRFAVAMGID